MYRFLNILKFQVNKINELLETYIKNVMVSKKNVSKKKIKSVKKNIENFEEIFVLFI